MDVVNFAEGILGVDKSSGRIVAESIRKVIEDEHPDTSLSILSMISVACKLESDQSVEIDLIREIGEHRLSKIKQLCVNS